MKFVFVLTLILVVLSGCASKKTSYCDIVDSPTVVIDAENTEAEKN